MKIGIEAQRIFRKKKHGMDFVALETIRHLQKIDKVNEYVIFVNEGDDPNCLQETQNFEIEVFGGIYPVWEQVKLPAAAKRHGCDVLHCTSNTAPIFCPVPLVVTVHDIIYFETNPLTAKGYNWYQRFGNLYRRLVVRQNLKKADTIITVSHFEKQRFLDFLKLPSEKLKVVYNGVGSHFQPLAKQTYFEQMTKKYRLPERYFLFLGNTDPKKNTPNTVRAFAEFLRKNKTEHYLVVADLDPQVVRRILKEAGLEEHFAKIHFTGYIHNQDLPAVINLAEVFLYPSKRESFGIPILEAMASGTAVITSNAASMPEVSGGAALLVNPDEVSEIVEAMEKLAKDESYRRELQTKGLERARDFSWENTARDTLKIYQSLNQKN